MNLFLPLPEENPWLHPLKQNIYWIKRAISGHYFGIFSNNWLIIQSREKWINDELIEKMMDWLRMWWWKWFSSPIAYYCSFVRSSYTHSPYWPPLSPPPPRPQVERAQDDRGGAPGAGGRTGRPQPVRAGAAVVHAHAGRELLLGRGRAPRLRRLRGHGLRGHHAAGRGVGEPQPEERELHRQGASAPSSLMTPHHHRNNSNRNADYVLCAVTANDDDGGGILQLQQRRQRHQQQQKQQHQKEKRQQQNSCFPPPRFVCFLIFFFF